jgi:hypothetical protein
LTGSEPVTSTRALLHPVEIALVCGAFVAVWLAVAHDALSYYTTSLGVRGYETAHPILRPSGELGHLLGFAGTLFLFATLPYLARKRLHILRSVGRPSQWLEVHIFCGVFGPILITYHTSFRFNGIVSVAYWSMLLVVISGFVGRYLYVRIPRTIRGEELSRAELEARAEKLEQEAVDPATAAHLRRKISKERDVLLRRIARLEKTRRLFQLWHVFHRPFVWVMFLVFFIHFGVALYFGYMPFRG